MGNVPNSLSDAVTLFLGFGSAASPRRDRDRLVQEFGPSRAASLEAQVASLLDEVGKIQVDWSNHSLESAGEMVRTDMQARHPDLSDAVLSSIGMEFHF